MDVIWVFFGIGAIIFTFGAYRVALGYLSRTWPTVSAEVLFSRVEVRHSRNGTSANIRMKYRYFVSGREYLGRRFCFGSASAHSHAVATQELVKETNNFDVSYCRSCPSLSVAKPGVQQDSLTVMGFGLSMILIMFFFI